MKFGQQLEEYELPEWRGQYLPYDFLKKRLKEIETGQHAVALEQLSARLERRPFKSPRATRIRPSWPLTPSSDDNDSNADSEAVDKWWSVVKDEVARISMRVNTRLEELQEEHRGLLAAFPADRDLRVLESLRRVGEGVTRLREFIHLNQAAIYKITKKHDKTFRGKTEGLAEHYPGLTQHSPALVQSLSESDDFDELEKRIRERILQCHAVEGLQASPQVAFLAACIGPSRGASAGNQRRNATGERLLFFFLGSSIALTLAILVLIAGPNEDEAHFLWAYFFVPFPAFRVVWSFLLSYWCAGVVARVCHSNFVNHMFILDIDVRCRVTPTWLFGMAAMITSLWVFVFGMYVVDYKWQVFPTVVQTGNSYRSSWHFVLYPAFALGLSLLVVVWPSKVCNGFYRNQLLHSVGRTIAAPLFRVTFGDNLVGDVMTSLTKPLQDVPATICYFASHHPQRSVDVDAFTEHGSTCSASVDLVLIPLIAGLPFFFRLMQCLRRFYDSRQRRHLCNFGKYLASLAVVFVGVTLKHHTTVVASVSLMATVYSATWDIAMDWGLSGRFLCGLGAGGAPACAGSSALEAGSSARDCARPLASATTEEANANAQATQEAVDHSRHFTRGTYLVALVLDVLLRMTWVLTLLPTSMLSDDVAIRSIYHTGMSTCEIFRRSMWAVFRIEYEQVSNASGYRPLLGVPIRLDAARGEQAPRTPEVGTRAPAPLTASSASTP